MPSCNCGGKRVPYTKHRTQKATVKKATPPSGSTKALSARAKRLSAKNTRIATAKAKANAAPCKC